MTEHNANGFIKSSDVGYGIILLLLYTLFLFTFCKRTKGIKGIIKGKYKENLFSIISFEVGF